jgi:hypothetical protein
MNDKEKAALEKLKNETYPADRYGTFSQLRAYRHGMELGFEGALRYSQNVQVELELKNAKLLKDNEELQRLIHKIGERRAEAAIEIHENRKLLSRMVPWLGSVPILLNDTITALNNEKTCSFNGTTVVCPINDRECGDKRELWCSTCPKRLRP